MAGRRLSCVPLVRPLMLGSVPDGNLREFGKRVFGAQRIILHSSGTDPIMP